jgi:hypothetical protein
MGTRSLTRIFDGETEIVCIYKQYDGYPSGLGQDLDEFVNSCYLVNGFNAVDQFNGAGDLAARLVEKLREGTIGPGQVYLLEPGSADCGEEYVYEIRCPRRGDFEAVGYGHEKKKVYAQLKCFDATSGEEISLSTGETVKEP